MKIRSVLWSLALLLAAPAAAQTTVTVNTKPLPTGCTTGQVPVYSTVTGAWSCASSASISVLTVGDGSAAAPSINSTTYQTTGVYWSSGPTLNYTVGGVRKLALDAAQLSPVTSGGLALGTALLPFSAGYFTSVVVGDEALSDGGTYLQTSKNFAVPTSGSAIYIGSNFNQIKELGASQLILQNSASTAGVAFNFATDSTLKVFARDGSSDASLLVNVFTATVGGFFRTNGGSNTAASGVFRARNSEALAWRNNANSGDLTLTVNTSDIFAFLGAASADTATVKANKLQITGLPAFVASDKYVVVDSSGNFHVSALGPASEPSATHANKFLVPSLNLAGYVVLTSGEYADFQAMRASYRANQHVSQQ